MKRRSTNRQQRKIRRPARIGGTGRIFCDEAGFTGNNLMDAAQEVFVFASVAMEELQAKEVVDRIVRDYKLQSPELKGSRLLKTESGRRAITSIIKDCALYARLVSHLKKFALACKFFEYIFEPALADQNSLFYGCEFHLFISNLLFAMLRTRDASAEMIFEEFSKFMRDGSQAALEKLFPRKGLVVDYTSDPLAAISVFAMLNRRVIQEELDSIRGDGTTPHWILDLTTTSLFSVLSHWGEVYDELDVYCDQSKPIEADIDFLKVMVGRRDHVRLQMFGKDRQYTFNLVSLPKLVDSKEHPGIQVADVFASAMARAFQQRYWGKADSTENEWLERCRECFPDDNVWPDLDHMNLRRRPAFVNAAVLIELAERCLRKQNLFEGMPEIITAAYELFPQFVRDHPGLGSASANS
jgi:hypothetical protein